ncbi:MAG: ATP-binding cassette domain-containing protein [Firmicutes bacterium]|nr:ATP-binding cassette domain-containing protein [Bacillota bacterium]
MALPLHLYMLIREGISLKNAYATALVLLIVLIILNSINVGFNKKITAIIGPSGCGKSTLLKTFNAMIYENNEAKITGDIFFNGENLSNYNIERVREKIGLYEEIKDSLNYRV